MLGKFVIFMKFGSEAELKFDFSSFKFDYWKRKKRIKTHY